MRIKVKKKATQKLRLNLFILFSIILLILGKSVVSQDPSEGAPVSPDYQEMSQEQQIKYLESNFGIKVSGGALGAVQVEENRVSITGGDFEFGGGTFSGGRIIIKEGKIVEASEATISNYNYQGAGINGKISLSGNNLILEEGKLSLGSETSPELSITAKGETEIDVADAAGEGGYSGEIIAQEGTSTIKLRNQQAVKTAGRIKLKNGLIEEGEKIEAIEAVQGIFAGISEGRKISFAEGKVEKGKVISTDICVDDNCFRSEPASEAEIGEQGIKIKGRGVRHWEKAEGEEKRERREGREREERTEGREGTEREGRWLWKRTITSEEGATLDTESGGWKLSGGTEVTEKKGGRASSTVKVRQETDYFPEQERTVCDQSKSCIAIDAFNSVRIKVEEGKEIKFSSYQAVPSLIVDKIKEGKVRYVEHYLGNKKEELIALEFEAGKVKAYPPARLKEMGTSVVFDYEDKAGTAKQFKLNSLGQKITINEVTVARLDEQAAENYYRTESGTVIGKKEKERYEKIIREAEREAMKVFGAEGLSKEEEDALIVMMIYDPSLREEKELSNVIGTAERAELLRRVVARGEHYTYEIGDEIASFGKLIQDSRLAVENDLLRVQLEDSFERGSISKEKIEGFHNVLAGTLKLDSPEKVRRYITLIERMPSGYEEIGSLTRQSFYLRELYKNYYAGKEEGQELAFLEGAGRWMERREENEGKEIEAELGLNLPEAISGELPLFLKTMDKLEVIKGRDYSAERERLRTGMELWAKAPRLMKKIEGVGKASSLTNYFESSEKGFRELLAALEEARKDPDISMETRAAIDNYYVRNRGELSKEINKLHNNNLKRERLVGALPASAKLEILGQPAEGLGKEEGLYRSSEDLIFRDLAEEGGGGENFMALLRREGYELREEKTRRILRMLAAGGQIGEVIPKGEAERGEMYETLLEALPQTSLSKANDAVGSILRKDKLKEGFAGKILEEYEQAKEEGDEEKIRFLEYTIRRNEGSFKEDDPQVRQVLTSPQPAVLGVEKKLIIPDFIRNSEKRGEIPVLKGAVIFTDAQEEGDPAERTHFGQFGELGGGFKVTERKKGGYVLERKGEMKGQPVIFRLEVYDNPTVMETIRDDPSYFLISSRGHSFSAKKVWGAEEDYQNNIPRIALVGSCSGAEAAEEASRSYQDTAFFATRGIGVGKINNAYTSRLFEGLERYENYEDLWRYTQEGGSRDERAAAYVGPDTFFAEQLRKEGKG